MFRSISLFLLCSFFQHGFSQQKDFERFIGVLDSCRASGEVVIYEDSVIQKNNYELKWTKIVGTYGGSDYCCEGKVFRAPSKSDTLFPFHEGLLYPLPEQTALQVAIIPGCVTQSGKGNQYLVETFTYPEPQPTSAEHFVYVILYYEMKAN